MTPRKLRLRRDVLTRLDSAELERLAGGNESLVHTCPLVDCATDLVTLAFVTCLSLNGSCVPTCRPSCVC